MSLTTGDVFVKLDNLTKVFTQRGGLTTRKRITAVNDVNLEIRKGEVLGLVGESGCGKSTLARIIAGLEEPSLGSVSFLGGNQRPRVQMVFQDPVGSLNPRRRVGSIITEPLAVRGVKDHPTLTARAQELMGLVGLNPEHYNRFPSEFSGGQRQRIGLARALAGEPDLLICDEPVSALDVSIQAQVLNLLARLTKELGLTTLFISHNLSVVEHVADRVGVMYLGRIVEINDVHTLFTSPTHPYTHALLSAAPIPDPAANRKRERLVLAGDPPSLVNPPTGCSFNPRCPLATDICRSDAPPLVQAVNSGAVACHHPLSDRTAPHPTPTPGVWPELVPPTGASSLPSTVNVESPPARTPWQIAWSTLRKDRVAIGSTLLLCALGLFAAAAPLIAKLVGHGPDEQFRDIGLSPAGIPVTPNLEFLFGTDQLGRDLLVRCAYGAQISLAVGIFTTLLTVVVGTIVGATAGYRGGIVDTTLSRFTDIMLGFPFLLTASALVAVFRPGVWITIFVIVIFSWTSIARLVRGQVLSLREREFIDAARLSGARPWRIIRRELVPNLATQILVYGTLLVPNVILTEAALSFLGLGIVPPRASWGSMIDSAVNFYSTRPTFLLFPSLLLFATTLAFNLLGDSLRDALDPQAVRS